MKNLSAVKKHELYHLLVGYFNLMQVKEEYLSQDPHLANIIEKVSEVSHMIDRTEEKIKVLMFGVAPGHVGNPCYKSKY